MNPFERIAETRSELLVRYETLENKADILKARELKDLFGIIPTLEPHERSAFGQNVNALSVELKKMVAAESSMTESLPGIDVTAPFDVNAELPMLLPTGVGSKHPLMSEIERLSDIFSRMGFVTERSREIDDQFHMFESLNFPADHPARAAQIRG